MFQGFHATIFAYGQTGSGKTYTMEGYDYQSGGDKGRGVRPVIQETENNGITLRTLKEMFTQIENTNSMGKKKIQVSCSFLQIYNEKVFDLLNATPVSKQSKGLRIRWNKTSQFSVENLFICDCKQATDAIDLFNIGIKNKIVASHQMNHASSRSHCIFTVNLSIMDSKNTDNVIHSKLQLVDLAGSERVGLTGSSGLAYKESIDINKSLLTLRKVITCLAELKGKRSTSHIPYRESKLTSLLKQSLGGNSFTLMIACMCPSNSYMDENISTLTYATKASYIANDPKRNDDPRIQIIRDLKSKISALESELKTANDHIGFLTDLAGKGETPAPQQQAIPTDRQNSTPGAVVPQAV